MGSNLSTWAALKPGDHLIAVYHDKADKDKLLQLIADASGAPGEGAVSIGCGEHGHELSADEYSDAEGSFSLSRLADSLRRRQAAFTAVAGGGGWLAVDATELASVKIGQTSPTNPPFRVWEEAATVLLTEVPIVLVCLYDRERIDDESMVRLFCCHSHFAGAEGVSANPVYLGLREAFRGHLPELGPMARALDGYERRAQLQETFKRISSAAESLPPEELLDIALDSMMDILRADAGIIRAVDPLLSPMPVLAHRGLKPESLALAAQSRVGEDLSGTVAENGQAILVEHVAGDPRPVKGIVEIENLSTVMALPLKSGQQVIGVLSLAARGGRAFTEDEFRLARSVSSALSHFLFRAILYGEAAGLAHRMEVTAKLTYLASLPLDQKMVERVAVEGAKALQADACACLIFTDGWSEGREKPFLYGLHGSPCDLGLPAGWPDQAEDPLAPVETVLKAVSIVVRGNQWGENRVVIAPLAHGGVVLGVLMGARGPDAPPFTPRQTTQAVGLATGMATAMVNQRLAGARARQIEDVRLASRIGNRVAGILEVKEALAEAARLVVEMVKQARVDIWLLDPDGSLRVAVGHGDIPEFSSKDCADVEGGPRRSLVDTAIRTGQPSQASCRHEGGFRSRVCVPLKLGEPAIGVLEVRTVGPRPFDPDRIPALESIAEHLVATIRNGLLFEEVNRSRRQLETIMGNMGEPLIVMELGGVVSFMNVAAVRTFGEQIGRHCHEILAGRHEPCPDCPLPWGSGESWTYRYDRESADGRIFDIVASSLPSDDGPAVVAIVRDTTEERLMHSYLAQHELMSAVGEMASGVAHNFNNILTGILGTLDDLKDRPTLEKVVPALELIERSAMDGADLVRRLLASTRTREEPGQVLDIRAVVQDAIHVTRPRWKSQAERAGKVIKVLSAVAQGLAVRGQPAELQQVFINLIINAVDALPDGGRIEIEAAARDGTVEVRVSDDGIGMTKEVMAKLFQPFFTTKGKMGSGLGLSTAYNILRNHGGSITVESAPAVGTTFTVTLPLCEASPETEAEAAARAAVEEPGQPGRILIVDDDRVVLEVLGALVAAGGHQVRTVGRGTEALQLLTQEPFDVVITDLGMPEMNGWEVAAAVREIRPQTGLILLTGWGNSLGDDENKRPMVDLVMAKPVRVAELLGAVTRVRRAKLNLRANEQTA